VSRSLEYRVHSADNESQHSTVGDTVILTVELRLQTKNWLTKLRIKTDCWFRVRSYISAGDPRRQSIRRYRAISWDQSHVTKNSVSCLALLTIETRRFEIAQEWSCSRNNIDNGIRLKYKICLQFGHSDRPGQTK